nr:reverse transcriptase domain-containing protein [Tanacetum cinerariifolium]
MHANGSGNRVKHGNKHEKRDNIAVLDGMSILSGRESVPGIIAVIGENGKKDYSVFTDANSSSSEIAKVTHAVNQQTSDVTTAMTTIFKQFQATPPSASVKSVEEICVTCGGAGNTFSELRDNIQGYVAAAAVNYNQGNFGYCPPGVANQIRPPGFAQPNVQNNQNRFSQPQRYNQGNNFNQDQSYQAPTQQNQVVPLIFFQMNTASTSGSRSLPSNTIANPKGELKAITTRSGIVLDGPSVPIPHPFINPEEDERLHINITLADALILIPKYQKMLKSLLSNKEKLLELANTPLNENYLAVILKKLPEKLGDPEKFLIPCGFSELKCKALADLELRLYVPNVLTTHPTLMLDSDFIPSDNSLPEYEIFYFDIEAKNSGSTTIHADISLLDLECFNFNGKRDPGELTSIVDFGIRENVLFATNVNLPPEEDRSPLFAYVVWIFLSFLTYPVVLPNLLSFGNEDTIFDPDISNYHFPSLLPDVSHRCETFMKFIVYPKLLNVSPVEILSSTCSPMEQ